MLTQNDNGRAITRPSKKEGVEDHGNVNNVHVLTMIKDRQVYDAAGECASGTVSG